MTKSSCDTPCRNLGVYNEDGEHWKAQFDRSGVVVVIVLSFAFSRCQLVRSEHALPYVGFPI